jgi:hypothetical protein
VYNVARSIFGVICGIGGSLIKKKTDYINVFISFHKFAQRISFAT